MIVATTIYLTFGLYALIRIWDDLSDEEPMRSIARVSVFLLWGPLLLIALIVIGVQKVRGRV